jgi:hypothetical protein
MIDRLLRAALPVLAFLILAACATTQSQIDPAISSTLSAKNVSAATQAKMNAGQVLDYNDILGLVQKGVPTEVIVGYLNSTRKVYNFTYAQLQGLKAAGATSQLLNYLTETQGFYGHNSPAQTARLHGEQKRAYFNTPLYQDQQPFAYNPPIIDDWYDSAYEESLYSPFSFNN